MKLQSLQSGFSAFFRQQTAGCFAEAQVLQRMAALRSRTACSAAHLLRQVYNEKRGTAAALDFVRDAPDPPSHF